MSIAKTLIGQVFRDSRMWDVYRLYNDTDVYEYEAFDGVSTVVLNETTVCEFIDSGTKWYPHNQPEEIDVSPNRSIRVKATQKDLGYLSGRDPDAIMKTK